MKNKTSFFCTECGNETVKWAGKCPGCGAWNTLVESIKTKSGSSVRPSAVIRREPKRMNEVDTLEEVRFTTGISDFPILTSSLICCICSFF